MKQLRFLLSILAIVAMSLSAHAQTPTTSEFQYVRSTDNPSMLNIQALSQWAPNTWYVGGYPSTAIYVTYTFAGYRPHYGPYTKTIQFLMQYQGLLNGFPYYTQTYNDQLYYGATVTSVTFVTACSPYISSGPGSCPQ